MPPVVTTGAQLTCAFGTGPSTFQVLPTARTNACGVAAATIMDCVPMTNIMPFMMCTTLSNPQVAAATSAAQGVLTPMPCIPVTAPWSPGSPTVKIGGLPALTSSCTCQCTWGGMITVTSPGQATVNAQ